MRFIKLKEDAILPKRATIAAAGYDVYANETVYFEPNECKVVKTGISFEDMKDNQYLQMSLRSGTSLKRSFLMANGIGIIDSDYEGQEIGIILFNRGNHKAVVDKGERMAQMVLLEYHTIDDEEEVTTKRTGGFGHTGSR